ncbi:MAG: hypothetical protein IRY92_09640 [Dactylosporangium sp.]|nr:hypothetical protein [Dactylosporangium sp.]
MTNPTDRRRRSVSERRSHTIHVDESLWLAIGELVADGAFANYSHAMEEAMKLLLAVRGRAERLSYERAA